VDSRDAHPLVGLVLVAIGIACWIVLSKPWSSAGAGFIGVGGAMLLQAWTGPLERDPRRKLATFSLGGVAIILVCFAVIIVTTTQHSMARLLGNTGVTVALVCLVVALLVRARKMSRRSGPLEP
jgi:peptidoglycan/LPS O-acetylase OafA/YrhL